MIRNPRKNNISKILHSLWVAKNISRIQISRELGLNKSTISDIISILIKKEIVLEKEEGDSRPQGGRKPVQLELNNKFGYVIGLEIRLESYTVVAVDLSGAILYSKTEENSLIGDSFENRVIAILNNNIRELKKIGLNILGAGIGMSGIIDSKSGIIIGSIALKIGGILNFEKKVASHFDFPVYIENDANCCAWGELTFHRSKQYQNFIFTLVEFLPSERKEVYESISVGFGIVFGGKVYHGSSNSAGEFHSIFCQPGELGQFHIPYENMVIEEFIEELSKHLALFTNTFNLGQIFLGGDIEEYQDIVEPILSDAIKENWMYSSGLNYDIKFSSLAYRAVSYGAAGMVLERLFDNPDLILNL
ncbi:MAG: hypothetical protein B6229_06495 [Spirochaetaceae bacterium 4572_7]|nr:MAG: hypothetical protein B6229_06495 [Spirochaetaceae bacterium 4572_7]